MKLHISIVIIALISIVSFSEASPEDGKYHRANMSTEEGRRLNGKIAKKCKNVKNSKNAKNSKTSKASKACKAYWATSAERAVTMWWVLFNKPSACTTNPAGPIHCGIQDVMANAVAETNDPDIAIIHASGGISDRSGDLRLVGTMYKTDSCALDLGDATGSGDHYTFGGPPSLYTVNGSSKGYCPATGEETEVHIVLRDHGPVTDDKILQLTRFTDPSCAQNGGPNLCVDNGAVAFAPMATNGVMTKDIGHFPMFPPGCFDAGTCDEEQEDVQLSAGMGNEVTLVVTGDTIQAVAEVKIPRV